MTNHAVGGTTPERIGFRHEIVHNAQGSPFNQETPLSPDDFLDPQVGDVFLHGEFHDHTHIRIRRALQHHFRRSPMFSILEQVKLILPQPARHHPVADLVIVKDLRDATRPRAQYDFTREGVLPTCVIEITSPHLAHFDLQEKRDLYATAGIHEYIILDSGLRPECTETSLAILGYRLVEGHYIDIPPNPSGHIISHALRLGFGVVDAEFNVLDHSTGLPLQVDATEEPSLSDQQAEARFRAQSIASQLKL